MTVESNVSAPAPSDRIAWLEAGLAACLRMAEDAEKDPENFVTAMSMRAAAEKWAAQLDDARVEAGELAPRPMTGLFAHLTPEQKAAALAYDGPQDFGSDEFLLPPLAGGHVSQIHAGDGGEARRRQTQALGELLASDGDILMEEVEANKAMRAESERGRLDFEARYAAAIDAAKLRWLEGEGDDGGSLWWHQAMAELTCIREGESPEAFSARTIAMRENALSLAGPDEDEAPFPEIAGLSSRMWDSAVGMAMMTLEGEWDGSLPDAVDAIWSAAEAVMAEAGPMPLVLSDPWVEGDDAYRAKLIPHIGTEGTKLQLIQALGGRGLDEVGRIVGLPRARLVLVEG